MIKLSFELWLPVTLGRLYYFLERNGVVGLFRAVASIFRRSGAAESEPETVALAVSASVADGGAGEGAGEGAGARLDTSIKTESNITKATVSGGAGSALPVNKNVAVAGLA